MSRCISDRKPPSPVKCLRLLVLGVAALFGSGCAVLPAPETASAVEMPALADEDSGPLSKSAQAAVTPDQAMRWLREGNERFVSGRPLQRNVYRRVMATARDQYPFASILSCTDSLSSPEQVFDQSVGDVFSVRVAGHVVNRDVLGSLEYASKVGGAHLIVVLAHTHCSTVRDACDGRSLGNMAGVVHELQPAVRNAQTGLASTRTREDLVRAATLENIRLSVRRILEESPVLRELVQQRRLAVVGAVLDEDSGTVSFEP